MKFKAFLIVLFSFFSVQLMSAQSTVCDETNAGQILQDVYLKEDCEAAGGRVENEGMPGPPVCTCPQLNFDKSVMLGFGLAAIVFGFYISRRRF